MTPKEFVALRARLGYNQKEIAGLLHTTERTVQRWESGENAVSVWVADAARRLPPKRRTGGAQIAAEGRAPYRVAKKKRG